MGTVGNLMRTWTATSTAPRAPARRALRRAPVWPLAAAALPVGFAVAEATGVRPIGGVVMVALLGVCAWRRRDAGVPAMVGVAAVVVAAFIASHVLHDALTVPGAVALAGAAVGSAAYGLVDRRAG
jgi:MYXO-CTERM domain-containing protein